MRGRKSIWNECPAAKDLASDMIGRGASYEEIRAGLARIFTSMHPPSDSQIYRLRKELGQVAEDREKPARNGNVSVWKRCPAVLILATELLLEERAAKEICAEIVTRTGETVTPNQVYKLQGALKKLKIPLDPPFTKGEEGGKTGQEQAITGNNGEQRVITDKDGRLESPPRSEIPPEELPSPPAYMRPYIPPPFAKAAPRGVPLALRDKFISDVLSIDALPEPVRGMLTHDPVEKCQLKGVTRQSKIGCLKRQVTAGHSRYVRALESIGKGKTGPTHVMNVFYASCENCENFLCDKNYRIVIEGLKAVFKRKGQQRKAVA